MNVKRNDTKYLFLKISIANVLIFYKIKKAGTFR